MLQEEIDILENDLVAQYPDVLEILLRDHTTQKNIFWAANNYDCLGGEHDTDAAILPELITSEHTRVTASDGLLKILSRLDVLGLNRVCTDSCFSDGGFAKEFEANAALKYTRSQFARFLILQLSINLSKEKIYIVPRQNFTTNSDIDWTKSIPEIDQQLYKKYQLSAEEVAFIESMIKPMG